MRLPYLQVTQEAWTSARMLAGVLGIKRREALGLVLDLWAWGLYLGPEDQPPSGICDNARAVTLMAGALEWDTDPEPLCAALVDIGLLERLPVGVRVRGLKRYHAAWLKKEKDRKRKLGAVSDGSRAESARIPLEVARNSTGIPGESRGQTQTQTQTQKKEKNAAAPGAADLLAACFDLRALKFPNAVPEDPFAHRAPWEQAVSDAMAALNGDRARFLAGYSAFLENAHWSGKTPPCPLGAFIKQWRDFVPGQSSTPENKPKLRQFVAAEGVA